MALVKERVLPWYKQVGEEMIWEKHVRITVCKPEK